MKRIFRVVFFLFIVLAPPWCQAALELSDDEYKWLEQNRSGIKVGFALIPPYLSKTSKPEQIEGFSADYLQHIEQILQVDFDYVLFESYGAMIKAAKTAEIDVVFAATKTEDRSAYLRFTPVYSHLANKIFTREGEYQEAEMQDFSGKRFAVPEGTALVKFISVNYPDIELITTKNLQQAFSMLTMGQVDGVGSYASAGYLYTVQSGVNNISIVGSVGFDYHISIGSRIDQPILNQLLTKALQRISPQQKTEIEHRWLHPVDTQRVDLSDVKQVLLYTGLALVLVCLSVVVFWNRSLKREMESRKQAQAEVQFLAYHDELTGVYNRHYFLDTLAEFTRLPVAENCTSCLLLVGLDSFSALNESAGHTLGDYVLKRVAQRLENRLSSGAVIARTGGDEFSILMREEHNQVRQAHLAELLIGEISNPILYGNQTLVVRATVGIACQTQENIDSVELLECADMALHRAKAINTGSYLFYSDAMGQQAVEREALATSFRLALDTVQIYLVYQPQISIRTGQVIGFEALARWNHPEKGNIPPNEFIPLAEQERLIVSLGDKVLDMACQQGQRWLMSGIEFSRLAVNVSVKQFIEPDFSSKVLNCLSRTGFPAEKLELEITESLFLSDRASAKETMDKLVQQGIQFAIDDFGTGFSSLLYLKELPVSKLKLDQGFVRGICKDNSSLQIVKASLQMGRALNMEVIAEGVEDDSEKQVLEQLGCDQAQGYLYSRPVPVSEITTQLLREISERAAPLGVEVSCK